MPKHEYLVILKGIDIDVIILQKYIYYSIYNLVTEIQKSNNRLMVIGVLELRKAHADTEIGVVENQYCIFSRKEYDIENCISHFINNCDKKVLTDKKG